MDQIQQNLNSPANKKKIGAIFGGEFSDLGQKHQNQARKHGVGGPKRDQRGS